MPLPVITLKGVTGKLFSTQDIASGLSASTTKNLPHTKATTRLSLSLNQVSTKSRVGLSVLYCSQPPKKEGGFLLLLCKGTTLYPSSKYASANSNEELFSSTLS